METYSYEATTKEGNTIAGTIDAANERLAIERLQELGYFPFKVSKFDKHKKSFLNSIPFLQPRVKEKDVMTFTYQLGVLLDAGFPLDKSLSILSEMTGKKPFRDMMNELLSAVRSGKSLSGALSGFPSVFPYFM